MISQNNLKSEFSSRWFEKPKLLLIFKLIRKAFTVVEYRIFLIEFMLQIVNVYNPSVKTTKQITTS